MKFLTKFFYCSLSVMHSVNAFAASDKSASSAFSNWRIGIGIAAEYAHIDANLRVRPEPVTFASFTSNQSQTCRKIQASPSLELGTTIMNNYYFGFLVSWHYSNAKANTTSPLKGAYHFEHQFKLNSYTNAFLKAGYKFTPSAMFYGLIGPSIANWSHTTQQFSVNQNTQVSTNLSTFKMRGNTIGFGFGAGFEYLIQNKYALSFEYTAHIHRTKSARKTISYQDVNPSGIGGSTRTRTGDIIKSVQPSYSTFAIRLTYFF